MSDSIYTEYVGTCQVRYRELGFLGYEGYRVGDNGSAESRKGKFRGVWTKLKTCYAGCGYLHVTLCSDGVMKGFYVHHIVLFAFVGPMPEGMECCHEDDNKLNNNLSNLKWKTHLDNVVDKVRNGRTTQGDRFGKSKLKEIDVCRIILESWMGETRKSIAMRYGVCGPTVSQIMSGKNWSHIPVFSSVEEIESRIKELENVNLPS